MISKVIDAVTKADIEELVNNQVRELRHIEYKQTLPGGKDDDKKEFLADVSSFANAGGGDLIYGIEESAGNPTAAVGVSCNLDQEILRLESMIRTGIEPRIIGFKTQPIEGFPQGPVLIIRIPRSWSGPHLVSFKNSSRFFTRSTNGKYQMDVTEIRSAFLLSDTLPQKIRQFRDDRLGKIIAGETPVPLLDKAKLVLHILPYAAFAPGTKLDLLSASDQGSSLSDQIPGANRRYNLDGLITYAQETEIVASAYTQFFRAGQIEWVDSMVLSSYGGENQIESAEVEKELVFKTWKNMGVIRKLGLPAPLMIVVSMLGVRGKTLRFNFQFRQVFPIDRDTLILPDLVLSEYPPKGKNDNEETIEMAKILRPVFDALGNACGYPCSHNFDKSGNWAPR